MSKQDKWVAVRVKFNKDTGKTEKFMIDCNTNKWARADDPTTWTSYDKACNFARENGGVTLAYALTGEDKICCIDIDHCVDKNGNISELAKDITKSVGDTYIERSISGEGYHIFGKTDGMDLRVWSKDGDMEFYQKSHFIVVTGDAEEKSDLKNFDNLSVKEIIESKCEKRTELKGQGKGVEGLSYMDDREVIEKATKAKHGDTFKALYEGQDLQNNHSNSDMSLMNRLAFWCNGDKEQMIRIFATSGLYRPEKPSDYYECTAVKAIKDTSERFQSAENNKVESGFKKKDYSNYSSR